MMAELRLGPGLDVLDFGAGSCWLSSCLNRLGCRTVAVDVSEAALELGQELFALDGRHRGDLEPRFLAYDGHRLPLPDRS
ncbi:MAG TPA: class I SAM-dependent methyltransferase, partial [Solirubrobacterales bacterium]|nr:class I SAM-dependent methyltransferase [Solirubrobacterales bacterium]